MRRAFPIMIICLVANPVPGQTNTMQPPRSVEIDGYAAKVNDRVITRGEVREAMAPQLVEIYRAYQGPQLEEELQKAFNRTLGELVERALIMEAFEAKGGQIPDQYVNDEIRRMITDRYKGDKALFEQILSEQKTTREEYAEKVREQIAVSMMMGEEVSRRARITPEQVRRQYEIDKEDYFIPEKVKFSVIVLNKGTTPEEQAVKRSEAEKVRQRLIDGADFGETAKEVSEGSRAADGGSFPWMQPKDARPEIRDILENLPAGEISPIVEIGTELYVVKVEAIRQAGYQSFDEVRDNIKNALTIQERSRLKKRWLDHLRETNYVVIYD